MGEVARATLSAIDFPQFVAALIQGTFQAIVDASIQQMEAYAKLLQSAATTIDRFMDDQISDGQARDYLAEHCGLDVCRGVLESNGTHSDTLWKGVAEMGWLGAAVPEEYGGAGFSRLELALIALEVGRALAPIPFGPSAYLVTEALLEFGSEEQKKKYLPRLVSGELIGTFAYSERAGRSGVADVATTLSGGALSGVKFPVTDGAIAGLALVVSGSWLAASQGQKEDAADPPREPVRPASVAGTR